MKKIFIIIVSFYLSSCKKVYYCESNKNVLYEIQAINKEQAFIICDDGFIENPSIKEK